MGRPRHAWTDDCFPGTAEAPFSLGMSGRVKEGLPEEVACEQSREEGDSSVCSRESEGDSPGHRKSQGEWAQLRLGCQVWACGGEQSQPSLPPC